MAVFKRGDTFHYDFMIRGDRYRGSTKEKTPGKARTFESMLMAKIVEGGTDFRTTKAPILSEVAPKFLAEIDAQTEAKNLDSDTKRHYHNGWRTLKEMHIAGMRIDHITTGIAASLRFPGGPWNARACQQVLGRILNWSADKGYIRVAPRIKRSKANGRSMRIEPWMEAELLKHMEQDVADVFVIMLDCGMRPEEVMRMRWENVHWPRNEYFNPFGKTAESRRFVPMSDRIIDVLRRRQASPAETPVMAKKAETWVFPGKTKAGHRITVAKKFEEARAAAGLDPKIVLYLARHELGTTFLKSGGDLGTLMKVMGHTSIATTSKYLHPDIEGAADVINRRNRAGLKLVKKA